MKTMEGDSDHHTDSILQPTIEWLERPPATKITHDYLEYGFREAMRHLFGEFGASVPLEVQRWDGRRATLRVPRHVADKVTAALALSTHLLGAACVVHVHGRTMAAPSRYFVT